MVQLFVNIGSIEATTRALLDMQPGGTSYDVAMRTVATDYLADVVQRVHVDGNASDGSPIGSYSSKPIYVSPKNSPQKITPEGKTGRTTFKSTGQSHITKYYDGGYKDFRSSIGQVADKVVLVLSGALQNQLSIIPTSNGYGIGWQNGEMRKRADGIERKYGKKIWYPTADEIAKAKMTFQTSLTASRRGATN